jgi:GMP synthase-like glutamine amidotransferase
MLARAAGAAVSAARAPEIGWFDVTLTPAGVADPVLGVLSSSATVFQWHHYTFALPRSGAALAESEICLQAFRLDRLPAWGIQFHAEVTHDMISDWIEEDPDDLPMSAAELLAETEKRIEQSNAQGRSLADAFLCEAAAR